MKLTIKQIKKIAAPTCRAAYDAIDGRPKEHGIAILAWIQDVMMAMEEGLRYDVSSKGKAKR